MYNISTDLSVCWRSRKKKTFLYDVHTNTDTLFNTFVPIKSQMSNTLCRLRIKKDTVRGSEGSGERDRERDGSRSVIELTKYC